METPVVSLWIRAAAKEKCRQMVRFGRGLKDKWSGKSLRKTLRMTVGMRRANWRPVVVAVAESGDATWG